MARFRDANWNLPTSQDGTIANWDAAHMAALMDIRDELKKLNSLLSCPNFVAIPGTLRQISKNTTEKRRTKKS